jgi:hypothetical protein
MGTLVGALPLEIVFERGVLPDESVQQQVWALLAGQYPPSRVTERRSVQRFPYPHLLYLTPAADGCDPRRDSIVVVGKHLSERGLGFFYHQPLEYRRAIASLEALDGRWLSFLMDITWCRYTQHGWYDNGGRFLQVVEPPVKEGFARLPERTNEATDGASCSTGVSTSTGAA